MKTNCIYQNCRCKATNLLNQGGYCDKHLSAGLELQKTNFELKDMEMRHKAIVRRANDFSNNRVWFPVEPPNPLSKL